MTRPYRLLALAPAAAILGAPWFANRIEPRILGMPFLLGWIVGWVFMASVIMATIGILDTRAERADATGAGTGTGRRTR